MTTPNLISSDGLARLSWPASKYNIRAVVPWTVKISDWLDKRGMKGHRIPLQSPMVKFVNHLNAHIHNKGHWALAPSAAWVNDRSGRTAECIGFGSNVVRVIALDEPRKLAKLAAINYTLDPFGTDEFRDGQFNYDDMPWFVHKITCVKRNGSILNPGKGLDLYIPFLKRTDLWIPWERLEFFPSLPMSIVVKVDALNVRTEPKKTPLNSVGYVDEDDVVTLYQYRPRGGNVWGRISQDGDPERWICLLSSWIYYTSWTMKTQSPVPPR